MFQAEVRKNQIISQIRVDCYYIRCEDSDNNVLVMGKDEEWYDLNAIEESGDEKEIVSPEILLMSKEQATQMMEDYNYKVRNSNREKQNEVH